MRRQRLRHEKTKITTKAEIKGGKTRKERKSRERSERIYEVSRRVRRDDDEDRTRRFLGVHKDTISTNRQRKTETGIPAL